MHPGAVQHIAAFRHAQKPGALLVSLRPQLRHFQHLPARAEGSVLFPVLDDIFRRCGIQPRHPAQKRRAGRIQIHTHSVDAVLHHAVQRFVQPGLGAIMLVLPHADGFGVNFHQLCQGILQPAGNRHSRTQIDIILRKFLRRQGRCGIDRSPRLIHHHIADAAAHSTNQLHRHLLRLPAGRAIADGQMLHAILLNQFRQFVNGFLLLPRAIGGINHCRVQHLSRAVHHGYLAAVAVAGIQSHGYLSLHWRLHQKWAQIQGKVVDGALLGRLCQQRPHLPFQRRLQQAIPGILRRSADKGHRGAARYQHRPAQRNQRMLPVQRRPNFQKALPLAAVNGQHLMSLHFGYRCRKVIIQPIDTVLRFALFRAGKEHALFPIELTQGFTQCRIVGNPLGNNIRRSGQSLLRRRHALFLIQELLRRLLRIGTICLLGIEHLRQRFQPFLPGRCGAGTPFLLVGAV